jgi:DNA-binding PadR family transcriptional regulator
MFESLEDTFMHAEHAMRGPWPGGRFGRFDPRMLGWLAMAREHGRKRHGGRRGGWHGPPFGPGGFPFARGPRARRGDVRAAILALLAEEPRNGYQIMQAIEERSEGVWRPSPGSVYPALQQLEDEGLVRADESGGRKLFHLTDAGRAHVVERADELAAPWEAVTDDVGEDMLELRGLIMQVSGAVMQVAMAGSQAQVAEASKVMAETRRALYRILAEDEPREGSADV